MKTEKSFAGTFTALVTPFDTNGKVYEDAFNWQIDNQVMSGVDGIVPTGTTGESTTLSFEEHIRVIELAVKFTVGRVKVLAGTGANSTSEAIHLTKAAQDVGADGSLQVVCYYNKPTQEGLFQHFSAIARATPGFPIVLYDIPSRCVVGLTIETVCRLREANPNIIGIKVANGSTNYASDLRIKLGPDFTILSGDDSMTIPFMSVGADGVISVVSNVVPATVVEMVSEAASENFGTAREIHAELFGLTNSLFIETNPMGVKYALKLLRKDTGVLRLPMVEVKDSTKAVIRAELVALQLLE